MTYLAIAMFFLYTMWRAYVNRPNSARAYANADQDLRGTHVALSIFTIIGAGEFVSLMSFGYTKGLAAFATFAGGVVLGFGFIAIIAPRIISNRDYVDLSIADIMARRYGKIATYMLGVLSAFSILLLILLQFSIGVPILSAVLGIGEMACTIIMILMVLSYLILSGYRGVLAADATETIVIFSILFALIGYFTSTLSESGVAAADVWARLHADVPLSGWWELVLALLIPMAFAIIGGTDVWQRAITARSSERLRVGVSCGALLWLFVVVAMSLVGAMLAFVLKGAAIPEQQEFMTFLTEGAPPWLRGILSILVFAAVLSTADVQMFVFATFIASLWRMRPTHNAAISSESAKTGSMERERQTTRIGLLLVSVLVVIVLSLGVSPVFMYWGATLLQMPQGVAVLCWSMGRGDERTMSFSIALSGAFCVWLVVEKSITNSISLELWELLLILAPFAVAMVGKARQKTVPSA